MCKVESSESQGSQDHIPSHPIPSIPGRGSACWRGRCPLGTAPSSRARRPHRPHRSATRPPRWACCPCCRTRPRALDGDGTKGFFWGARCGWGKIWDLVWKNGGGKKLGALLLSKFICVVAQLFCVKKTKNGKKNAFEGHS